MDCVQGMQEYVDRLERDFHHRFAEIGREADRDVIHKIRLNLKKQRALFQLMEHLDPAFSADRADEAYGKLYKKLGKVRDMQVEQAVVGKDESLLQEEGDFADWLNQQEKNRLERLAEFAASFSMIKVRRMFSLVKNRIAFLDPGQWKPGLNRYFMDRFEQLRAYLHETSGPETRFHECRRLVKELSYNLKLMEALCEEYPVAAGPMQELDSLQDLLGSWHDHFFCLEDIRQEQVHRPEKILKRIASEKEALEGQIEERLADLDQTILELEKSWSDIILREKVSSARKPVEGKRSGPLHTAFGQLNMLESTR